MTRTTCPDCRLRFTAAMAAALPSCPFCGGSLLVQTAEECLGYRLTGGNWAAAELPIAVAAALPIDGPDGDRRV